MVSVVSGRLSHLIAFLTCATIGTVLLSVTWRGVAREFERERRRIDAEKRY